MSALAKIKKQAAQLEHDRQYDRALALYARLLDDGAADAADDEIDVALYNRAGDVALRAGDTARAVSYYERALDRYATGGFLNNAIALGAKILRQAPERVATHYTLGVLYAKKGFRSDARQHFLSYAERMHRGGQATEVARSLADYVVLCDGAADARAGLAAHLASGAARPADVATRLAELLEQALQAAGQLDEPGSAGGAAGIAPDLVFLDLDPAATWEPPTDVPLDLLVAEGAGDIESFDAPWSEPLADAPAVPAAPAFRLQSLPGELAPLAPSLVALDAGSGADWSVAAHATQPAVDSDDPTGLPLIDVDLGRATAHDFDTLVEGDEAYDAPSGVPAFSDAVLDPEIEREVDDLLADVDVLVDLPAPVDAQGEGDCAFGPPVGDEHGPIDLLAVVERQEPVLAAASAPPAPPDDGLDLGAWLRDSEPARSTRLVAPALPTTGDEQADFQATLQAFKAGIARSLADADFDAHYDLGVAYKEMGLLEEAIGEFQKAARAPERPLRALEALAECFLERGEPQLVLSTLAGHRAALDEAGPNAGQAPRHVALCYLLGAASQEVGRTEEARGWFLRVLATDYAFRDAATRLASLSPPTR